MAGKPNTLDGQTEPFVRRIELIMADIDTAKGLYMAECKERREDIKDIYTEVKDAGLPVKSIKGLVKRRLMIRKIEAIPSGLDIDEASVYETLCETLGELGAAAAKKAGFATKSEAVDSLVEKH